ncbi:serine threonine- kinase pim-2-like protein [Labeo rohita]|uniref:non-specific serine/threonine protein kinase n=1 Tax=Labeo rohita TaxID=84645 RepID=A0A498NDM3_LABRO|nr:serine threonine- kinase pim-2-like protein [Labeo rohita]
MGQRVNKVMPMTVDYIFSRYSVGDQLGKGGFGVVYEGRRLEDDLKVALKYVTKTDDMESIHIPDHPVPLPKEIALTFLANKGHRVPEIIRLLDWTDHPDHFVMVLECPSPCENLVEFMRRHGGSLDEHTVRQIMWQATNAAHMCCLRRVLHRDVKLENLLINRETSEVKLIDFGCGDILRMSPYRSYHGTAAYSPPEYYSRGEYCGWPATVWSLGILMFAMLCGHFPSDFDLHLLQYKRWSKPGLSKGNLCASGGFFTTIQMKNWSDSRQFCRDHGADLVIIKSKEKQSRVYSFIKENMGVSVWIGLSDIEIEGNMKWVDNSPLKEGFWLKGEPNDNGGNEDCVLMNTNPDLNNWNDISCSEKGRNLCE